MVVVCPLYCLIFYFLDLKSINVAYFIRIKHQQSYNINILHLASKCLAYPHASAVFLPYQSFLY